LECTDRGERGVDIARRSEAVIHEIGENYQIGNVLVVSHKATIRIILCNLLGIDVGRFRDRIAMPVGGVSVVELGVHGPLMHALADRSYLEENLRSVPGH